MAASTKNNINKAKELIKSAPAKAKELWDRKEPLPVSEGDKTVAKAMVKKVKDVGAAIASKMPMMSDPPAQTNHIYKVQGPFPGQDMTPTTRMNSPKKYKKG